MVRLKINFSLPEIGAGVSTEQGLMCCWEKTSSVVGHIIALENVLVDEGFVEIESKFKKALIGALPRVVPGYALLLWFTSKAGKPQLMDLVWRSFENSAEALSKLLWGAVCVKTPCVKTACLMP